MSTATIRDVARAADVSIATVSRALNGHMSVSPETHQRVIDAVNLLGYVPHLGARSLSTKRSNTIGVVLPDLFGEFFSEIIRGIDFAAHQRDLQLLLSNMHGSAAETAGAIRMMRGRVDGLLLMSPEVDADFLANNLPKGLPTVVMNGPLGGAGHASISIDNHAGACAAVAHLAAQGCRRIAHLRGPRDNADADAREQGYLDAVSAMPDCGEPLVFEGDFTEQAGVLAARALLADRRCVDGVFSANDVMAFGCMAALAEAGVAVPADIAFVGFDDVPTARYVTPALSTMGASIAALGERALARLLAVIEAPDQPPPPPEYIVPQLIARASSIRRGAACGP
ncbi:MAG: LacI family DNA-binding transcriptional regulator [Sphingomonas sp.]